MSSSTTRTWHLTDAADPEQGRLRLSAQPATGEHGTVAFTATLGDGQPLEGRASIVGDRVVLLVDGVSHTCHVHARDAETWLVHVAGHTLDVGLLSERALRRRSAQGTSGASSTPLVTSPMAGRVVAVKVAPGTEVVEGQTLVIIEAMKMENDIKAARSGLVEAVFVGEGSAVEVGSQLLLFAESAPTS